MKKNNRANSGGNGGSSTGFDAMQNQMSMSADLMAIKQSMMDVPFPLERVCSQSMLNNILAHAGAVGCNPAMYFVTIIAYMYQLLYIHNKIIVIINIYSIYNIYILM